MKIRQVVAELFHADIRTHRRDSAKSPFAIWRMRRKKRRRL